jgi:uncharacterized protein YodC (DUF2158 family)
MAETWNKVPVVDVKVGDTIRVRGGDPMVVSEIETNFFGRMYAFIENSNTRWFKQPVPPDGEVEVLQKG